MGFSPIAWSRRKRIRPVLAVAGAVALCAGAAELDGATANAIPTAAAAAIAAAEPIRTLRFMAMCGPEPI